MLKKVVLLNIFVETITRFFHRILQRIEKNRTENNSNSLKKILKHSVFFFLIRISLWDILVIYNLVSIESSILMIPAV